MLASTVMLISVSATTVASAAGPQLKLVRARAAHGEPVALDIFVMSKAPIGAYTLELSFDPAEIELVGVGGGSGEFAAAPITNPGTFSTGKTRFSNFHPEPVNAPTGRQHIATVRFRPRVPRGRARVEVRTITLADTSGSKYHPLQRARTLSWRVR